MTQSIASLTGKFDIHFLINASLGGVVVVTFKDSLFINPQAETWYGKAAEFWPSKAMADTTPSSSILSPASNRYLQQNEDRLSRFLVKFPPPSPKELLLLETFLEKVPDTEQRNQAKLLTHRCRELEKIIRARETRLQEFGRGREGTEHTTSAYGPVGTPRFEHFIVGFLCYSTVAKSKLNSFRFL